MIQPSQLALSLPALGAAAPASNAPAPTELPTEPAAGPLRRDTAEFSSEALKRLAAEQAQPDT